ncbi:hypothetical protein H072_6428 [Dactylellina haptotyla CBS 200.50]|uniref:Rhodopsin domain-containing protein n=1 Tax=Dactylellina haptotyla (strain CBS 200.50) TaxID=1284197 RepID=S8AA81_DACHA|nr:hypothetical protein H072_6428 [Dactylellina haptotyla CBS 200.50]
MSSSTAGPGAPIKLEDQDIVIILTTSLILGPAALNFADRRILYVIDTMAKFAAASENFTITPDDMVNYFGTRPNEVDWVYRRLRSDPSQLAGLVSTIALQAAPYLPHNHTTQVLVPLFVALTVMTTIAIAMRMWSRHQVANGLKLFDFFALLGFLLAIVYGALAVRHSDVEGQYRYYYDRTWNQIAESFKLSFILNTIYPWAMLATKLSLLMFYYSMTKFNWIHYSCYAIGGLTIANTIAAFIIPFTQCHHVNQWDYRLNPYECKFDSRISLIVNGAIYILTDVAIWILPMPLLAKLKLATGQKVLAVITFSLGGIACVAGALRLWVILTFQEYSAKGGSNLEVDVYTILELNLALICASAPAVRALIMYYAPKVMNTLSTVGFTRDDKDSDVAQEDVSADSKA